MASGDANLPATDASSAFRRLNVGLLRVLLRLPVFGSPLYLEKEDSLIRSLLPILRDLIQRRPWLRKRYDPDTLATAVCYDLMFVWRRGAPLWFTPGYLWNLVRRHLEKDGKVRGNTARLEEMPDSKRNAVELAEEVGRALRLAEEFRSGLAAEERKLFEAWVRHTGKPGWKKAYAVAARRSPTWVSNHLEHLRQRLRSRHHIADPDDFIDALQFYSPGEGEEEPESGPAEVATAEGLEDAPPRVDLAEAFAADAELLSLLSIYGDRAALTGPEPEGDPDALLGRGLDRYLGWARDVGRPRVTAWKFYRRIASGRVNVEAILARDTAAWTAEERRHARRVAECARPTSGAIVPFDELPARLGLGRRAIDQLLLKLQAAGRDQRVRRGPSGPL